MPKIVVMLYVFYDTDRLLSCALFCFLCSVLFTDVFIYFIYFCIFPVTALLVELYMCLFCTSDSKGGLWSTWFYLYVYVVCSNFLFSYFCAWFVMCWFCFFFFFTFTHISTHLCIASSPSLFATTNRV